MHAEYSTRYPDFAVCFDSEHVVSYAIPVLVYDNDNFLKVSKCNSFSKTEITKMITIVKGLCCFVKLIKSTLASNIKQ